MNSVNTTAAASAEKQRIKKLERDRARMWEKRASDEKKAKELESENLVLGTCVQTLSWIIQSLVLEKRRMRSEIERRKLTTRFAYALAFLSSAAATMAILSR